MPRYTLDKAGNIIPVVDNAAVERPITPMSLQQPAPEQFADEQAPPVEEGTGKWQPIGSPNYPDAKDHDDGISDLFRVTPEDVGASEEDLSDLTDVDMEHDVIDAGPDGTLDDLVDVSSADILGDDDFGQPPARPQYPQQRRRVYRTVSQRQRYTPPTSMGRSGG